MNNYYEEKWQALEAEVNRRGGDGREVVAAIKELYSNFDDGAVEWLASLYDPDIGGFYFSESARDNEEIEYDGRVSKLLPDIESTEQATNFLQSSKMISSFDEVPSWMRDKMAEFICSCEDPETGYFYHPQWGKEYTDTKLARRGRDLMWAEDMADKFNFKLPYPTANERLRKTKEEKVGNDTAENVLPDYLLSEEAFMEHLKSYDWDHREYWSGNRMAAQATQVKAAGLGEVAVKFLNSIQDPETGLWGKTGGYDSINAFLKISCFYRSVGHSVPHVEKAVRTCLECINSTDHPIHVCTTYNNWFSIHNILLDLHKFGGDEGKDKADEIAKELLLAAPEAIRSTAKKVKIFKKKEGCFSYCENNTSGTSQGMPVAIFGTNEGDINANGICSTGTVAFMFRALELEDYKIPLFSPNAYDKFLAALKSPTK